MGWLSGPCEPESEGTFVVFEERPEDSEEPGVVWSESGRVVWIDSGSGPGYEAWVPDED